MGELEKCFEKKLLMRSTPSLGLARKSLKQAKSFLIDAEDMIKFKKERMGIIALYNTFFHTARALLFKDGIKERSHFCVARYIEERCVNTKAISLKFLTYLDLLREIRHDAQYSLDETVIEEDLEDIVEVCKEFISVVEKLLK